MERQIRPGVQGLRVVRVQEMEGLRMTKILQPGNTTTKEGWRRRTLGAWYFEDDGVLTITLDGPADTEFALDMAEILLRLRREELAKKQHRASEGLR
jgi:hypothetical protein